MNQAEFIRKLKENLDGRLPDHELEDILSDYESFFMSGRDDGKTDDDISSELGSPEFLASQLLDEQKEAGEPDKRIAGPGSRLGAFVIDAFVAIIPSVLLAVIIGSFALPYIQFLFYPSPGAGVSASFGYAYTTVSVSSSSVTAENGEVMSEESSEYGSQPNLITSILAVFTIIFYLFYALFFTMFFKGQTIGKKLMGIRVRGSDRGPATKGSIFFREFIGKILLNSIPIIPLVSLVTILLTREHKALHDMMADTIVSDV